MYLHNQPAVRLAQVRVHDLEKRFRSKKEMHNWLVMDCNAYLPKFFMKAIIRGEKEVSAGDS